MCNGLEGLFLALVEIDPCEMAKGTITECILDHPFNSGSTTTIIIRLLPEQLSNIIVQHRWDPDFNPQPPSVTANGIYTYSFFCPKNVGRVVYWKKKCWPWKVRKEDCKTFFVFVYYYFCTFEQDTTTTSTPFIFWSKELTTHKLPKNRVLFLKKLF